MTCHEDQGHRSTIPNTLYQKIVPWPHGPGQFEKIEVRPVERIERMGINFEANLDDEKI